MIRVCTSTVREKKGRFATFSLETVRSSCTIRVYTIAVREYKKGSFGLCLSPPASTRRSFAKRKPSTIPYIFAFIRILSINQNED